MGTPWTGIDAVRAMSVLAVVTAVVLAATASGPGATDRGCDRWAGPGGADRAPGTEARPFRSPQRLASALAPGETGCLRNGTYSAPRNDNDPYVLRLTRGGTPGAPITLRSAPGERARLRGIVMVTRGADQVRLTRLTIEGTGGQNTVKVYADDTTISRSRITNRLRGQSCVLLGSPSSGRARRTLIRHNRFHDCGAPANGNQDHAVYVSVSDAAQITGNTFVNAAGLTLQLYPDAQRTLVARNVIDAGPDSVRGGIVVGGGADTASAANVITHNIIAYAATSSVYTYWQGPVGRDNVMRRNCTWGARGEDIDTSDGGLQAADNVNADPHFADRRRRDYRLRGDGPCRGVLRR